MAVRLVSFFFLLAATAALRADEAGSAFATDLRPLLETYCFACHGGEKHKGDVDLSSFKDEAAIRRDPTLWKKVVQQLDERSMPPRSKPQPTQPERERLSDAVRKTLADYKPGELPNDPGRPTVRRLNRAEYNNTIRDLLGVDIHPADLFPADGGGGAGFDNNGDTLFLPPILMEHYLRAAGEVIEAADSSRYITVQLSEGERRSPRGAARENLNRFARRAFRRPVETEEIDRFLKLFDRATARGDSFEQAMKLAAKGMLVSPRFLFRIERDQPTVGAYAVDDDELASRLSYFIWSSMPDDELLKAAGEGKLHEPAELERQARRMLADARSKALAEQFGVQWLKIGELKTTIQPDRNRFKKFTPALRDAMYDEAVAFVDSVFRDDKSLLTLIDADYTFVNEDLARHYGLKKVEGQELRRVTLEDKNRGGIASLGAVLTVTSYPLRTSPVLRGKWVLEAVLGAPPPPPPPDVPALSKDDAPTDGLSFRKRLELHRSRSECASCHNRMDPLGFGLENFDPIGRWRAEQAGQKIDAAGVLTTGETFAGPAELKKVLLVRKADFVRNLAEKMLSYALGRGLEPYDQPTVAAVMAALKNNNDRAATLVIEIAKSFPFGHRRNEPIAAATP